MGDLPHIVHLTTHLGKGGAAVNVLLSAIGLREKGYPVTLLHGPNKTEEETLIRTATEAGVTFHLLPHLCREIELRRDRQTLLQIRTLLEELSPDLLHTHQSKGGILGRWAAKHRREYPIVHTPHGHVFYGYFPLWKTRLFIEVERRAARWCDRLIGLTEKEVEDHLERGIGTRSQWRVVPSGVSLDRVRLLASSPSTLFEEVSLPADSRVLLSVGRLEPVKGFVDFLPHIAPALEKDRSLHWIILGEGSDRSRMEEGIERHGLEGRVHLPGWIENPHPCLASAEGLLVPSKNEGMGRVVVEAFALGKPVFAATVGSLPELVRDGDHGLLFDWNHPTEVAGFLDRFIRNLSEGPGAVSIRQETAERYSVDRMIDSLIECYGELLA